ncbi:hypothetical protein NFI95_06700 [Acetobacteraceae bacterium KSS8]|uniref:Uncharacterized protein n=1 Tax=Endosaccharibacter trunci TaxID=2812733 RepID=A0ABT1W5H1_9PROT|nr:hypothetical protein [Acetobacteraceae bacterium KSS8]
MPSDDAVRQALLRMGSGRPRGVSATTMMPERQTERAHDRPHGYQSGGNRRGAETGQAVSPDARRRRFSQNEHVPVEYVSRDRTARGHEPLRLDAGRVEMAEPAEDRTGFLERELERERQARQAAEAALAEKTKAFETLRTRVAHLEIDLQEARSQRQAMIELAQSAAQHAAETRVVAGLPAANDEDDAAGPAPVRRGRGRPRRVPVPVEADAEPEPVKWWTD